MNSSKAALLCAGALLALAGLACSSGGTNVQATVDAVNTAVQSTLGAMTQPAATTPGAASATPGKTPAPATLTAQPTLGIATHAPPTNAPPATQPPPATATAGGLQNQPVRPNGALLHATHLANPPVIDAQGNDWPATLPNAIDQLVFRAADYSGPVDSNGHFALGWDTNALYFYAVIVDDVHVQTQHGELLFQGDSLELQIDADLAGDFTSKTLSSDDFQLGLSPGADRQSPEAFLWNPAGRKGVPAGLGLASRAGSDAGSYTFEASIPWSFLATTAAAGKHFGLAFNSSDDDTPGTAIQQSMSSSVATRKLLDPTSWGTFQLDP